MNRAERRRLEKAKAKIHLMSHDDEIYDRAFRAGMKEGLMLESGMSTRIFTTAMAAILHDEFGVGKLRLERILDHVEATLETLQGDLDRERRMREWVRKETGIDLDDYTGARVLDLRQEVQELHDMGRTITMKERDQIGLAKQ